MEYHFLKISWYITFLIDVKSKVISLVKKDVFAIVDIQRFQFLWNFNFIPSDLKSIIFNFSPNFSFKSSISRGKLFSNKIFPVCTTSNVSHLSKFYHHVMMTSSKRDLKSIVMIFFIFTPLLLDIDTLEID